MGIRNRIREALNTQDKGERVPVLRPAQCLGESCVYFAGQDCESRLELLEATGKSGGKDLGPLIDESSYALYGHVCTGGSENVVVGLSAESPNGSATPMELVGRAGRVEGQRIVLTPRD
ncbi:hypothetical protein COU91_01005 [Candidatus Saccharibacteria bacterium CG10_big_fil_rev_8_21_14_0_10_47_8]|nr:MAG: hypothetical protein COU91_01005 [Candidatus Saccharibacteria bacterium CG10_big_fil_rev_8_21_14_0_10_47_8]